MQLIIQSFLCLMTALGVVCGCNNIRNVKIFVSSYFKLKIPWQIILFHQTQFPYCTKNHNLSLPSPQSQIDIHLLYLRK